MCDSCDHDSCKCEGGKQGVSSLKSSCSGSPWGRGQVFGIGVVVGNAS